MDLAVVKVNIAPNAISNNSLDNTPYLIENTMFLDLNMDGDT
jgi:hypothetical protein